MGSRKRNAMVVRPCPHNQGLANDRHQHVSSGHERQPTEHPPFGHVCATMKDVPDPFSQTFVERHPDNPSARMMPQANPDARLKPFRMPRDRYDFVLATKTGSGEVMKFRAIDFVVVFVADMDRAVAFYRDTLGIAIAGGEVPHPVWNELETEPVTVALFANTDTAGSNASIGIAVDEVQAAVAELRDAGHEIALDTIETPVCYLATMHDPDGNILILHQRKDGTAG